MAKKGGAACAGEPSGEREVKTEREGGTVEGDGALQILVGS